HLGAVAGREHDRLAHELAGADVGQRLGQERVGDRHPLEELDRDGAVIQSDDDDRHAWRRSLAWLTWPLRIRSSMSESNALRQSIASDDRPPARTASRSPATRSSRTSYSGPMSASSRPRSQAATAGLRPDV